MPTLSTAQVHVYLCSVVLPSSGAITVPPGMVQDQFGMMGLLTFIRAAETDPNLVALALGRCVRGD